MHNLAYVQRFGMPAEPLSPGFYWVKLPDDLDNEMADRVVVAELKESCLTDRRFYFNSWWFDPSLVQILSERLVSPEER